MELVSFRSSYSTSSMASRSPAVLLMTGSPVTAERLLGCNDEGNWKEERLVERHLSSAGVICLDADYDLTLGL